MPIDMTNAITEMLRNILESALITFVIVYSAGWICDAIMDIRRRPGVKSHNDMMHNIMRLGMDNRYKEAMDKEDWDTVSILFNEYLGEYLEEGDGEAKEGPKPNRFIDGFVRPVLDGICTTVRTMVYGLAWFHLKVNLVIYGFLRKII